MRLLSELVFTDEQLTLLASMAGEPDFPAAIPAQLDEAGWAAVAQGLVARGILHDDDWLDDEPHDSDAILGVALFATRSLWMTLTYAPGDGDTREEILWFAGETFVRQTRTPEGFHVFTAGECVRVGALLDGLLDVAGSQSAAPAEQGRLSEEALDDAIDVLDVEGVDAAVGRYPAAAGYLAALDDARCIISVEASLRVDEDRVEGAGITLVNSPRLGLWIARDDSSSDGPPGAELALDQISADAARAHVAALAAILV